MFPVSAWLPALVLVVLGTGMRAADTPLTPRDGWRVERLLQAPELRHPSVVCSAPDGRIFVAEDPMDISTPRADVPEGRILCRHPDGRLTVFADRLQAVFGLQYLDGRLYVLHNPRFSVLADHGDHGEPLPDLIERTNPEPWALEWNDHVPANFRLGLDGFFYGATGDKGLYRARDRKGREVSMRGGVFRIRPDGTGLEAFSTGVRNILDVAVDNEDELFTYDNTDEHQWMSRLTHMVDGGFYGWPFEFIPRREHTLWCLADYGGGAATGALVYDGGAWPAAWDGNLFLADFGKRQILRVKVEREGATFRAVEREDLFPNPPADFKPVGISLTADGAGLLICDWQHRDSKDQATVGRLWRLTPEAAVVAPRPDWWVPAASGRAFTATDDELIGALSHPARTVRLTAQRRLAERPGAVGKLQGLMTNEVAAWRPRIHALWALAASGNLNWELSRPLVVSPDPAVARQAMRWLGEAQVAEAGMSLRKQLESADASRRFRAATALGRIGDTNALTALRDRLGDDDHWVRFAAWTALNRLGRTHPTAWTELASGLDAADPRVRQGTRFALRETYDVELVDALARLSGGPGPAATNALGLLGELHFQRPAWRGEWWAYHPAESPAPARTEAWAGTPRAAAALLIALDSTEETTRFAAIDGVRVARLTAAASKLEILARQKSSPSLRRAALAARSELGDPGVGSFFAAHLGETDDPVAQQLALEVLARLPSSPDALAALKRFWTPPPEPAAVLAATCTTTGALNAAELTPQLLAAAVQADPGVRDAAIGALGRVGDPAAVRGLNRLLDESRPATGRPVLAALGGIPDASARTALLAAASNQVWRADAIAALARRPASDAVDLYLAGLELPEARVREACRGALGQMREVAWIRVADQLDNFSPSLRAQLRLAFAGHPPAQASALFHASGAWTENDYLAAAGLSGGNEARGRELFSGNTGPACSRCHRVGREGGEIGPDLTHAGTQFDRVALAESILFPSQSVREGYQQITLELRSGETLNGLVRLEEPDALTLRDAEGRDHRVRKTDIQERTNSSISLMPEGLAAGLTPADWSDLLAYLESLR